MTQPRRKLIRTLPFIVLTLILSARTMHAQRAGQGVSRPLAGAIVGGAAGTLIGGVAGLYIGGNQCSSPGVSDTCRGVEGTATGMIAGFTLGIPIGAHLMNHRLGRLTPSLLTSVALAGAGVLAFHEADAHARGNRVGVFNAIVISVPVLQVVASTLIESRTAHR